MTPPAQHQEVTRHLANKDTQTSDISGMLELMHEPIKPLELSERHPVEREAVYEVTDPLVPWAIERNQEGKYEITAAGEIARRAYKEANETLDSEDIAWLSWSENRGQILIELRETGPITSKSLSEKEAMPGKRTIRRNFENFEERDWITKENHNGVARLTFDGERASREYDELIEKMEQVVENIPCLRDLELECADIPIKALSDAELVETTPQHALRIERRVRKLADKDFQHLRAFQGHWNSENAEAFLKHVKNDKQFEVMSPPLGFDDLPEDAKGAKCVIEGLRAKNYRWRMHTEELPCSLLILDSDYIVIGPSVPMAISKPQTGALFSESQELIDWGMELYETHRHQTKDPFDFSPGFSIGTSGLIELLQNRYLNEE